jgi:hypothetical protein
MTVACEGDGGEEQVAGAGVAHGNATPALQAGEGGVDAAALLVELAVVVGWAVPSVAGGDADPDATGLQFVPQPVGVIALDA